MSPGRSPLLDAPISPPKLLGLVGQYGARMLSVETTNRELKPGLGAEPYQYCMSVMYSGNIWGDKPLLVAIRRFDLPMLCNPESYAAVLFTKRYVKTGSILLDPLPSLAISKTSYWLKG